MQSERDGTRPFGKAVVRVTGIWKSLAKLAEKAADAPNVVFIRPPLYIGRAAATDCAWGAGNTDADIVTTLAQNVAAGADRMTLADGTKLRDGDMLLIDSEDPDREELIRIKTIRQNGAMLARPLMFAHRAGVVVHRRYVEWNDTKTRLLINGSRGESTVFLVELPEPRSQQYLRIGLPGDNAAEEVHRFQIYETESDADGFYQLPPLQRIGQVQLEASGDGRKVAVKYQPDFALPRNQVDFVFKKAPTPDSAEDNHA